MWEGIAQNGRELLRRVDAAARRAGRDPAGIAVVAVSKTKPAEAVAAAYAAGFRDFGENRVQELLEKQAAPACQAGAAGARWHLIGQLQSNKVRQIVGRAALIHSVDRLALAEEIEKQSAKRGLETEALLEVNVGGEASKSGFAPGDVLGAARQIALLPHVKVRGLMTVAPLADDPEAVRWVFRDLKKLSIDICKENIDNISMNILSMGMSNDFEIAIEEGSTMVRVGTLLFGHRS